MSHDRKRSNVWPWIFILGFVIWFWPGPGANSVSPGPFGPNATFGSVGVADENSETLFTASADGKTIYMWQYFSSKPPKFLGQSEAILSVK